MKFLKILKITFLILLIGGALYLVFMKGESSFIPSQSENQQETKTEEKELFDDLGNYEYEDEQLSVFASIPIDEEGQPVQEVYEYSKEEIERFESMKSDIETASFPWSLDLDYKTYESQTIISYIVQGYEYTGGAHGNAFLKSFNYDKKTGKQIDVLDIVSSEDSLNVFAALADKELVVEYPEGSSGTPENWSVWFAHDDGVTFIFAPYQIAPYAVGQQEFTIKTTGDNSELFEEKYFGVE